MSVTTLEDGEITEDVSPRKTPPLPTQHPPTNISRKQTKTVTPNQLDQAKDIVLDLLGWGVTPEYLVECGVSSQILYTIFSDLRLRLPKNIFVGSGVVVPV